MREKFLAHARVARLAARSVALRSGSRHERFAASGSSVVFGWSAGPVVALACLGHWVLNRRRLSVRKRSTRCTFLGGHHGRSGGQRLSLVALRPTLKTAAVVPASQRQVAGRQSTLVWRWLGRLPITGPSTRTPKAVSQLRRAVLWSPVTSDVIRFGTRLRRRGRASPVSCWNEGRRGSPPASRRRLVHRRNSRKSPAAQTPFKARAGNGPRKAQRRPCAGNPE